jgi:hypothetical protein
MTEEILWRHPLLKEIEKLKADHLAALAEKEKEIGVAIEWQHRCMQVDMELSTAKAHIKELTEALEKALPFLPYESSPYLIAKAALGVKE